MEKNKVKYYEILPIYDDKIWVKMMPKMCKKLSSKAQKTKKKIAFLKKSSKKNKKSILTAKKSTFFCGIIRIRKSLAFAMTIKQGEKMKKILGVSFAAILAVAPMVARADDPTTPIAPVTVAQNETIGVASTKYVKEAYNAMAGKVNAELGTINTAIGNKQDPMSDGKGINITSNKISVDAGSGLGFDGDTDSAKLVVSGLTNAHIASGAAIDQSKISNLTTDLSNKVTNAGQFTGSTDSALVKSKTVVNAIKDTAAAVDAINSAGYITKDVSNLTNYTTTTDMNTALNAKVTNEGQFTGSTDSSLIKTKTVVNAIKDTAAAVDGKVTNAGQFTADSDSALIKTKTVVNAIKDTATAVDGKVTNDGQFTAESDPTLIKNKTVINAIKDTATAVGGKQAALNSGQLNAVNSGITSAKVGDYDAHIADTNIHVTTAQKTEWSNKQDALNSSNSITIDGTTDTASLKTVATNSGFTIDTNGVQVTAGTANIVNGAVTADKLASDAVTTAKILNANVTTAKIAGGAVTADKLASDAVTTAKILNANVTTAKIADGAVTAAKLGAGIQVYSGWNNGLEPTVNPTTISLVAPVTGS